MDFVDLKGRCGRWSVVPSTLSSTLASMHVQAMVYAVPVNVSLAILLLNAFYSLYILYLR